MNFHPNLLITTIVAFLLTGCKTTDSPTQQINIPPPAEIEVNKSLLTSSIEYKTTDGLFEISGTSDDLESFIVKKHNSDVRDLSSFATAIYRNEIAEKLTTGAKLTEADFQLLNFCIRSQISAINAYNSAGLSDILQKTQENPENNISALKDVNTNIINTFDNQVKYQICNMQNNFYKSNSVMRKKISEWSQLFHSIPPEILNNDLTRIKKTLNHKVDDYQWRQWGAFIPGLRTRLFETKTLRPYKNFSDEERSTAMYWSALNTAMSYPKNELKTIDTDIGKYIETTKDARCMTKIKNIRQAINNEIVTAISTNAFIFTDLPFSIFCKNAYIGIQNCKGLYNDDENAMEDIVSKFLVRTSGPKMLEQLQSHYAADIYVQLLELIKSEFGETRYKNYVTRMRIYELCPLSPAPLKKNEILPVK